MPATLCELADKALGGRTVRMMQRAPGFYRFDEGTGDRKPFADNDTDQRLNDGAEFSDAQVDVRVVEFSDGQARPNALHQLPRNIGLAYQ